ncbi:MAG: sigma-70 family RNA polymerase sigma factor [Planctomycetota bacterium]
MLTESRNTAGDAPDASRRDEFVRLLRQTHGPIRACVATLVMDRAAVDDAFQEVCLILWERFDDFELGTSFRRWSCSVAYRVARDYWRRERRRRGYGLSEATLTKLATVQGGISEVLEMRRERLAHCMDMLSDSDRRLLREAYSSGESLVTVADRLGASVGSLYTRLSRLRARLERCIQRRSGGER